MKKFTLIELIAVISILGILAAMVIPNISSFQGEATETAIKADAKNLQTSVDMYQLDNYGSNPSEVQPEIGNPQPINFDLLYPKYLREIPKHDGVYYWVDYQGKVWLSPFDSPVSVINDGIKVSWTEVNGADYYNVFQVVDSTTGAVNQVHKLKFLEKVTVNQYSKDVVGKTFVVSAVNEKGFESAPTGSGYAGYPIQLVKEPVSSKPTPITSNIDLSKYNNVFYVDSISGDDTHGDGTQNKPFKTLNKVLSLDNDGDAIFIIGEQVVDNPILLNVNVDIIGDYEKYQSKITLNNYRLIRTTPNKTTKFYKIFIEQTYGEYEMFDGYSHSYGTVSVGHIEIHNSVVKSTSTRDFFIYLQSIKIENSLIDVNARDFNLGYQANATYINVAHKYNIKLGTNSTKNTSLELITYDSTYNITSNGWEHTGTNVNPDGTQSHIGVYGGTYAWGSFDTTNNRPVATMIINPNSDRIELGTPITFSYTYNDLDGDTMMNIVWEGNQDSYVEGTYTVKLRVQDSKGAWSTTVSRTFTVYDPNTYSTDIVPTMTSSTSPSPYSVTGSSYRTEYGNEQPYLAFDNSTGRWMTWSTMPAGGHWLKVDLGVNNEQIVRKIYLTTMNLTSGSHSLKDWELYASNDDTNWVKIGNGTQLNNALKQEHKIINSNAYRYYRINILNTYYPSNPNWVGIQEMELMTIIN